MDNFFFVYYWKSRKGYFIFASMKTIKIPEGVHTELKVFSAQNPEIGMSDLAGLAIMKELKDRGHKFVLPSSKKTSKK